MADLRFLSTDVDRHGNPRIYFRRPGHPKVRLREQPGTQAFMDEYSRALNSESQAKQKTGPGEAKPGSLLWLIRLYFATSADYKRLKKPKPRRSVLEAICQEKFEAMGDRTPHGDKPVALMQASHVRMIRDAKHDFPEAGNDRVKALRCLFKWGKSLGHVKNNPAAEAEYIKTASEGFHTWSAEEVQQYEDKHPLGTKARLALDLMLYTGLRRSDVVRIGPQMAKSGWLHFTEVKGQDKMVKVREIPILPVLQASIDAMPRSHLAYLHTTYSKPFTSNGFGNWFRDRCNEAGLPHCTAHGLRKAGATIAAENGATEHQLMAIFGWESPKQAALYTRKANRKRLTASAMGLLKRTPGA